MASKYHISDGGTPALCRAKSEESCPKTRAGDGFHGTLAEATEESENRFEESYGSTVTLGSQNQKKEWSRAAGAVFNSARDVYRRRNALGHEYEDIESEAEDLRIQGLAAIHGVDSRSVRNSQGDYIVEEADGTARVYGYGDSKNPLTYLGVLHPKLNGTVLHSSEHKAMIGDREATPDEALYRHDVEHFGYATMELKDSGDSFSVATDSKGIPTDRPVWGFIGDTAPSELFDDSSLRVAVANRGIIKD